MKNELESFIMELIQKLEEAEMVIMWEYSSEFSNDEDKIKQEMSDLKAKAKALLANVEE